MRSYLKIAFGLFVLFQLTGCLGTVRSFSDQSDFTPAAYNPNRNASDIASTLNLPRDNSGRRVLDCRTRHRDPMMCMICNNMEEAGGQGYQEQMRVSLAVVNRVNSSAWPNDICSVVYQGSNHPRCWSQFSWTACGNADVHHLTDAQLSSLYRAAQHAVNNYENYACITHFYAKSDPSPPRWRNDYALVNSSGYAHNFYRSPHCGNGEQTQIAELQQGERSPAALARPGRTVEL